jgi:hypothetical protein
MVVEIPEHEKEGHIAVRRLTVMRKIIGKLV